MEDEKKQDKEQSVKTGRPKSYKSKLAKSKTKELSSNTVSYSIARGRLPHELVEIVYKHSTDFGDLSAESWHGMKTHITDGTYLQLQETESIKKEFPVMDGDGAYPQALLQVFIRQGSGQITNYGLGNRSQSELQLIIPMINQLQPMDLLLADDLYNTYYHFSLVKSRQAHIIVPGKRQRNYTVTKKITEKDEIVEIKKGSRPPYITSEEWNTLPSTLLLRRIVCTYSDKGKRTEGVLYTTCLDEKISAEEIILKYNSRWDIEITIREIKTLMDLNVLRSKSPDMVKKELAIGLTAYNMVRKIVARSC